MGFVQVENSSKTFPLTIHDDSSILLPQTFLFLRPTFPSSRIAVRLKEPQFM